MYYLIETQKSFEQAVRDLESAVKRHGYGVLHIHDLGDTLRSKGVAFAEECRILEVCNPQQAAKVLTADMRLNMALPCRISVYTEAGQTKIGFIKPATMLAALSNDAVLLQVASEVDQATTSMVNEGAGTGEPD